MESKTVVLTIVQRKKLYDSISDSPAFVYAPQMIDQRFGLMLKDDVECFGGHMMTYYIVDERQFALARLKHGI